MRELGLESPAALSSLPIFPLPNCVLLPGGLLPLHVFEPRYRELTRDCLAGAQLMGIARLRPGFETTYYGCPPVYERCGVGRIICSEEAGTRCSCAASRGPRSRASSPASASTVSSRRGC
jgi:Lon protease-like protein